MAVLTVQCAMIRREDIKKAIINELSEEYKNPVQAFSDTFLRKNGFKAITKNDSKRFEDAVEWRFCGLACVTRERTSAYNRKGRRASPY